MKEEVIPTPHGEIALIRVDADALRRAWPKGERSVVVLESPPRPWIASGHAAACRPDRCVAHCPMPKPRPR